LSALEPPSRPQKNPAPLRWFVVVLLALAALRVVLPLVQVPIPAAQVLSVLVTLVFLAAPILALYRAASFAWRATTAWAFVGVGLAVHGLAMLLNVTVQSPSLPLQGTIGALGQTGLILWTVGLGAALATMIKDKNLLLPVGLFLAGFDVFTVVSEFGITRQVLVQRPELFQSVAYQVPTVGSPEPQAFVGPADMFFLAMFFVALYRFGMRARETFLWMLPALAAYLLIVIFFGHVQVGRVSLGALPALVPIGLVILLVNWREFSLTRTERVATLGVAAVALGLAILGFLMPARPVVPSPKGAFPADPGSANSPLQVPSR